MANAIRGTPTIFVVEKLTEILQYCDKVVYVEVVKTY